MLASVRTQYLESKWGSSQGFCTNHSELKTNIVLELCTKIEWNSMLELQVSQMRNAGST